MIYNLYSLENKKKVGNKAYNLMRLKKAGYNVPDGFVLSIDFSKKIKTNFSKNLKKQIDNYLKEIDYEELPLFPLVSRSSSIYEDTNKKSFAGQFKSIININSKKQLYKAIKQVIESDPKNKTAVIIQKQINPKISGVHFTKNPLSNKGFLIEYVKGHLKDLVSGKISPDKTISKTKQLKTNYLKELYKTGKNIEKYLEYPQDIEFAITKKNKIYILQSRDITTLLNKSKKLNNKPNKNLKKIKGISLSKGYSKSRLQFISDAVNPIEANKLFKKGNILVTHVLFPEYNSIFKKASGVICSVKSITSHPAIISRELEIPCVGGINTKKLISEVKDFNEIIVDSNYSCIYYYPLLNNSKSKNKLQKINYLKTINYKKHEKQLIYLIKNLEYKKLDSKIKKTIEFMQENFKDYLKNKNKKHLNEAKSYFFNLCDLLQNDFIYYLEKKGYSHNKILESLSRIDKNKTSKNNLERTYKVIKYYIQNIDGFAKIKNKNIWDY